MQKKKHPKFPKGFFKQPRPTISMSEAIKDIIPFKWNNNVLQGKTKVRITSAKNN